MAPSTFDQWFAIHNARSEKKIPDEYKTLFEECWNTAKITPEEEIKELKVENGNLQDEIDCNSCPYDYCRCNDYDDLESDLEDANDKLRKTEKMITHLKEVVDEFETVQDSLNNAIENADYQLIVDSVSKDFDNAFCNLGEVKNGFEALDI